MDFIPLPKDIVYNMVGWRDYLQSLCFRDDDPLFPVIENRFGKRNLLEQTLSTTGIGSDTTVRHIFQKAFEAAGFEYIKPHSFRETLAVYAANQTPDFLNAVRQNLGHNSLDTTFNSFGQFSIAEQRKQISSVQFQGN